MSLPDYVAANRDHWNKHASAWVAAGERAWNAVSPYWGIWEIPESAVGMLPHDMTGWATIELGCGTGYVSAWMARRGAQATGIDISERQLATAARLAGEHGLPLALVYGNAEELPFPDASFDFAISEYGAAIWADPYRWIPEAARVLRPGAPLVFLGSHPLAMIAVPLDADEPAGERLLRPYFGLHRLDWDDGEDRGSEFGLPISEWFRLFANCGLEVMGYLELQAPRHGSGRRFFATADWAHAFPGEHVWKVRKAKRT